MTNTPKDESAGYLEAAGTAVTEGELATLQTLATMQVCLEQKVLKAQQALAQAEEELRNVAEVRIPDLMDKVGMKEFTTQLGLEVTIKESIRASISEEHKPTAFAWLRDNGHAALITRMVAVAFGRGEDQKAAALVTQLRGQKLQPTDKSSVHPMTLSAFVREQLANGKDIPLETFGVHRQRSSQIHSKESRVKVSKPKATKG
jgi:hypothetical protein